jgi:pyruvate kinase
LKIGIIRRKLIVVFLSSELKAINESVNCQGQLNNATQLSLREMHRSIATMAQSFDLMKMSLQEQSGNQAQIRQLLEEAQRRSMYVIDHAPYSGASSAY